MKEKGKAGQRKETEGRQGGGQMEGFSKKNEMHCPGGTEPSHSATDPPRIPLLLSSTLISGLMRPPNPPGVESKSRGDPSALAKKPCWLVYKRAGRIRKLNHLWLLTPQPTDRHEILLVAADALSLSLSLSLFLRQDDGKLTTSCLTQKRA